jgi:hypothetical protein
VDTSERRIAYGLIGCTICQARKQIHTGACRRGAQAPVPEIVNVRQSGAVIVSQTFRDAFLSVTRAQSENVS